MPEVFGLRRLDLDVILLGGKPAWIEATCWIVLAELSWFWIWVRAVARACSASKFLVADRLDLGGANWRRRAAAPPSKSCPCGW